MGDRLALDWNSQAEQLRSVLEETTSLGFEAKASKSAAALARLDQSKAAAKEMVAALESLLRKAENVSLLAGRRRDWEQELLSLSKEVDRIDAAFQDPEQARQQLLQSRRLQQHQHQHQHFPQAASSSSSRGAADSLSLSIEDDDNHNSHTHLDTGELVQLQNRMLDDQDAHLDALSSAILRQKQIGLQIGDELDLHVDLLQQTDAAVERTQNRLGTVNNRVGDVIASNKTDHRANLCIIVLVLILVLIVFS